MARSKRPHEDASDDGWWQADDDFPDMSIKPPSAGPAGSEPTFHRRRTTPLYTDEIVSIYTTESVRRMDPKKEGKKATHRPQRHHAKTQDRSRPVDPRMHSTDLFQSRQLGSLALSTLLELANMGDSYEALKFSLRYVNAGEVNRLVCVWVDELLHCPHWPLRNTYSPVSEIFVTFVRAACDANRKRDVVEALARLVQEDDRRGNTELVS